MNILLMYFSGTGSTYVVSKNLANNLEKLSNTVDMISVDHIVRKKRKVDFKEYDMYGFVLPVYGFGVPANVFDLVEMLPRNKEKVFIIRTASYYNSLNKASSEKLIRALRKKWYKIFYDRLVVISSNFLLDFEDEMTKKLYEVTVYRKIPKIARDITKKKKRIHKRSFIRDIVCDIVYFGYNNIGRKRFGKSLRANERCTKCRKCERNCPAGNIDFSSGQFVSGNECLWCMRCVYECPVNAIHSKGLDFVAFRNGYNYLGIVNNSNIGNKKFSVSKKMWKYIDNDDK